MSSRCEFQQYKLNANIQLTLVEAIQQIMQSKPYMIMWWTSQNNPNDNDFLRNYLARSSAEHALKHCHELLGRARHMFGCSM